MTTEELKELIRTEPTVASTFADLSAEHEAAEVHVKALATRCKELRLKLEAIADAKAQLAAPVSDEAPAEVVDEPIEPEGEPDVTADEPEGEESET